MTQRWSALMAHELKTPMTRLRMCIEEQSLSKREYDHFSEPIQEELRHLETIVMDFLDWASLENDSRKPEIHAINIPKRIDEYLDLFRKTNPDFRIEMNDYTNKDFRIFCNPIHFDQLISNLLTNSSKYGGVYAQITCIDGKITIQDHGPGIPGKVINNYGKPFNKYSVEGVAGHGLGLAWVNTIANKYTWDIQIDNSSGTKIEILFPAS
jgi:signal transduction histidine kinase